MFATIELHGGGGGTKGQFATVGGLLDAGTGLCFYLVKYGKRSALFIYLSGRV
jgi:hypothetical protein